MRKWRNFAPGWVRFFAQFCTRVVRLKLHNFVPIAPPRVRFFCTNFFQKFWNIPLPTVLQNFKNHHHVKHKKLCHSYPLAHPVKIHNSTYKKKQWFDDTKKSHPGGVRFFCTILHPVVRLVQNCAILIAPHRVQNCAKNRTPPGAKLRHFRTPRVRFIFDRCIMVKKISVRPNNNFQWSILIFD